MFDRCYRIQCYCTLPRFHCIDFNASQGINMIKRRPSAGPRSVHNEALPHIAWGFCILTPFKTLI